MPRSRAFEEEESNHFRVASERVAEGATAIASAQKSGPSSSPAEGEAELVSFPALFLFASRRVMPG